MPWRPGLLALILLGSPAFADSMRTEAVGLRFRVPKEWTRVPATSEMRAAQYRVPRAAGDTEDGELVLFFFGKGRGGSVEDNLERWYGQFEQADHRPSREAAIVTHQTVNALRVTITDLSGAYVPGMGVGGEERKSRPGFRMLAAIVEAPDGPWFFKAVGPAATIGEAKRGFDELVASLELHR
jgi:hypothetical protein